MPLVKEITKPALGDEQDPSTIAWKSTLRSSSPSLGNTRQSRSTTRSDQMRTSLRSRTPSPATLNDSWTKGLSNMRKSRSGKLSASLNKSVELKDIESDYVKNLQQQVYFLELEANFLREQAKKATDMHPQMTAEAEKMLKKLRTLQSEVDGLQTEVNRKEASIQMMTKEKFKILARLSTEENEKVRMKREFLDEIASLKQERDQASMESRQLDVRVDRLQEDRDELAAKLRDSQSTVALLRSQLDDTHQQVHVHKMSLEEKHAQCIEAENRAKDVEHHFLNTTQRNHEREINHHKSEIHLLRQQLKDAERQAGDEKYQRNKAILDNDDLMKTGTLLSRQVEDLTDELTKEQQLRRQIEEENTSQRIEINRLTDRVKELSLEEKLLEKQLNEEKDRSDRYLEQIRNKEETANTLERTGSSLSKQLANAEAKISILERERESLRKDKEILTDHLTELQHQLNIKSDELIRSKGRIKDLEDDLNTAEAEKMVGASLQSERWKEFANLADNMKKLSKTMARTASPTRSPRSSTKFS